MPTAQRRATVGGVAVDRGNRQGQAGVGSRPFVHVDELDEQPVSVHESERLQAVAEAVEAPNRGEPDRVRERGGRA